MALCNQPIVTVYLIRNVHRWKATFLDGECLHDILNRVAAKMTKGTVVK